MGIEKRDLLDAVGRKSFAAPGPLRARLPELRIPSSAVHREVQDWAVRRWKLGDAGDLAESMILCDRRADCVTVGADPVERAIATHSEEYGIGAGDAEPLQSQPIAGAAG